MTRKQEPLSTHISEHLLAQSQCLCLSGRRWLQGLSASCGLGTWEDSWAAHMWKGDTPPWGKWCERKDTVYLTPVSASVLWMNSGWQVLIRVAHSLERDWDRNYTFTVTLRTRTLRQVNEKTVLPLQLFLHQNLHNFTSNYDYPIWQSSVYIMCFFVLVKMFVYNVNPFY